MVREQGVQTLANLRPLLFSRVAEECTTVDLPLIGTDIQDPEHLLLIEAFNRAALDTHGGGSGHHVCNRQIPLAFQPAIQSALRPEKIVIRAVVIDEHRQWIGKALAAAVYQIPIRIGKR